MIHLENWGWHSQGVLVGESVFRTVKLEILTESTSWIASRIGCSGSARVNGEH